MLPISGPIDDTALGEQFFCPVIIKDILDDFRAPRICNRTRWGTIVLESMLKYKVVHDVSLRLKCTSKGIVESTFPGI